MTAAALDFRKPGTRHLLLFPPDFTQIESQVSARSIALWQRHVTKNAARHP
ncbi:hypothetical protein GOZ90_08545 [Agrobacterium vitis]|uniref:Uncharacterized protein n=1 Tax=Agrobacterium vitis TaxID=373 RepID=A0A6L6V9Y8_AGRVI|nr:hypothetical protein [Agrobacterium vitis]MUZ72730.1 hypothetical protein [Agrobacterium vitis]MVA58931.1 hypothetical protein [Agrobacterium vitis]